MHEGDRDREAERFDIGLRILARIIARQIAEAESPAKPKVKEEQEVTE